MRGTIFRTTSYVRIILCAKIVHILPLIQNIELKLSLRKKCNETY